MEFGDSEIEISHKDTKAQWGTQDIVHEWQQKIQKNETYRPT